MQFSSRAKISKIIHWVYGASAHIGTDILRPSFRAGSDFRDLNLEKLGVAKWQI